jgi:hypothetical protein
MPANPLSGYSGTGDRRLAKLNKTRRHHLRMVSQAMVDSTEITDTFEDTSIPASSHLVERCEIDIQEEEWSAWKEDTI